MTAIFNRNRDVQPDRGCGCCWWSTHTRRDRSVQSFSVLWYNVGPRLWWPNRHQISENSDQQQPQQRSASHGGGCGCRSPYTGNLVEVAVGNRGCDWRSLSWMGPFNKNHIFLKPGIMQHASSHVWVLNPLTPMRTLVAPFTKISNLF